MQAGELALAEFERTRAESLQDMSHLRSTVSAEFPTICVTDETLLPPIPAESDEQN